MFKRVKIMLFSIAATIIGFSLLFGDWQVGTGLVFVIGIHEIGHLAMFKLLGVNVSLPLFLPFVGAIIMAPSIKNRYKEALIGYGGPLFGTILSMALYLLWLNTNSYLILKLCFFSTVLNLFNMMPVNPLDGGRVTQIIHPLFHFVGLYIAAFLFIIWQYPLMLLIIALGFKYLHLLPKQKLRAYLFLGGGIIFSGIQTPYTFISSMIVGWLAYKQFLIHRYVLQLIAAKDYEKLDKVVPPTAPPLPTAATNIRINWLIVYTTTTVVLIYLLFKILPHTGTILPTK